MRQHSDVATEHATSNASDWLGATEPNDPRPTSRASGPHAVEVKDLKLVCKKSQYDGNALRKFLLRVLAARETMVLPSDCSLVHWADIGIQDPGVPVLGRSEGVPFRELVRRVPMVMALPESLFKKTSQIYNTRRAALQKRGEKPLHAVYLVMLSKEFAASALDKPGRRLVDLANDLRKAGVPVWDTNIAKGRVNDGGGLTLGYNTQGKSDVKLGRGG